MGLRFSIECLFSLSSLTSFRLMKGGEHFCPSFILVQYEYIFYHNFYGEFKKSIERFYHKVIIIIIRNTKVLVVIYSTDITIPIARLETQLLTSGDPSRVHVYTVASTTRSPIRRKRNTVNFVGDQYFLCEYRMTQLTDCIKTQIDVLSDVR